MLIAYFLASTFSINGSELTLAFEDDGREYNPLEDAPVPDITLPAEEREIGGLGIFIVKKMSKNIEYRRENGKNILRLTLELN